MKGIFVELPAWFTAADAAVAWAWLQAAEDALIAAFGVEITLITRIDAEIELSRDLRNGSEDGDEASPERRPGPGAQVDGPIGALSR